MTKNEEIWIFKKGKIDFRKIQGKDGRTTGGEVVRREVERGGVEVVGVLQGFLWDCATGRGKVVRREVGGEDVKVMGVLQGSSWDCTIRGRRR